MSRHDGQRRNLLTPEMNTPRKKQSEENQLKKSEAKRPAKVVPLIKQQTILQHELKKMRLKSDAEKFAYVAGRAAAELSLSASCDEPRTEGYQAEEILAAVYDSLEAGEIYLVNANRILSELEQPLRQRNDQMRKKLLLKPNR